MSKKLQIKSRASDDDWSFSSRLDFGNHWRSDFDIPAGIAVHTGGQHAEEMVRKTCFLLIGGGCAQNLNTSKKLVSIPIDDLPIHLRSQRESMTGLPGRSRTTNIKGSGGVCHATDFKQYGEGVCNPFLSPRPSRMGIPFQNTYSRLPERFYSKQEPAKVPDPNLIRTNPELAEELGLDLAWLNSPDALATFSGNEIPEGAEPLAQAYAGHQFGGFVPQLGDGRAILLGEVVDRQGNRRDIQLKGSGRTAFSRGGDGKSALGPVLREYIVSEAMHALGVPTTRALAAVSTGEIVAREEPTPGGIFTRVASSHIRVGTFQYFAARQDTEAIRILMDHCIARHYPEAAHAENPALSFLGHVIEAQAKLVAKWLPIGFIHGVMNTDNCSISGETIDYGPCAFMDDFHPDCVFSFIDRNARYAWGNQPVMAHWNLTRLAETLLPVLDPSPEKAKEVAQEALGEFIHLFQSAYIRNFRGKLGLDGTTDLEESSAFIKATLGTLAKEEVDFSLFFRHLTLHAAGDERAGLSDLFRNPEAGAKWLLDWQAYEKSGGHLEKMQSANPVVIPRNHRIEESIQAAYRNDFAPFHRLNDALQNPYTENPDYSDLEAAPLPHERVPNTFCGT